MTGTGTGNSDGSDPNADQRDAWSNRLATKWIARQDDLDRAFASVLAATLAQAGITDGARVLDIGCGGGTGCLLAAQCAQDVQVTGVDISGPLLDQARTRAGQAPVRYVEADAQTYDLTAHGPFSHVISRFGVMFFADPVAAFSNIAAALRPGAALAMAAWGPPAGNPWFTLPHHTAAERLGRPPPADRSAPGPFAFHDAHRVADILTQASLTDVAVETQDFRLAGDMDPVHIAAILADIGPVTGIMEMFGGTPDDLTAIQAEILTRITPFYSDDIPGIPAQIHMITARA